MTENSAKQIYNMMVNIYADNNEPNPTFVKTIDDIAYKVPWSDRIQLCIAL